MTSEKKPHSQRLRPAGWIGVDLDGTLAHYDHWRGVDHIGAPIPLMVKRVKRWLAEGHEVKIFTARIGGSRLEAAGALPFIKNWCEVHLGQELDVTCTKDLHMMELWDDRCVRVECNTGRRMDDEPDPAEWTP